MQRIFQYGDIQNKTLTHDKELNILMYETPSYVITYTSYKPRKWSHFWPTMYICRKVDYAVFTILFRFAVVKDSSVS